MAWLRPKLGHGDFRAMPSYQFGYVLGLPAASGSQFHCPEPPPPTPFPSVLTQPLGADTSVLRQPGPAEAETKLRANAEAYHGTAILHTDPALESVHQQSYRRALN